MPTQERERGSAKGWGLATIILIVAVAITAAIGTSQAARDARILGILDLPFALLTGSGTWLIHACHDHAVWIATLVSIAAALMVNVGARNSGGVAKPLWLMAAAVSSVSWGEALLLVDAVSPGIVLYAGGFVAAILWGIASRQQQPAPAADHSASQTEWRLFTALMLLALFTRTYALTELPREFENEMIVSMVATHTLAGLKQYAAWGLISNTNGIAHLLPQWLSYQLLGPPVYSLRFTGVACGLVTTALFYSLTRRLGGRRVAAIATLLFIAAPDQLFWSRQENTPFQFVALLAVITANVGIRWIEAASLRTLLAATACMAVARLFYGPAMVMMLYPILLYGHRVLFVRGAWRAAWYTIPLLAVGVGLWVFSLSGFYAALTGSSWRFINPTESAGAAVWRGEGTFRNAGPAELLQLQLANLAKNATVVAKAMTYEGSFTNWYRRADNSKHPTTVNVAITVLLTIGTGYLLGRVDQAHAFALLAWMGLGMLPSLLSVGPVPRRMVVAFPAFYAVIGLTLRAIVEQIRANAGPAVARWADSAMAITVTLIAWAAMASYFLMPTEPTYVEKVFNGSAPAFAESDAIYHNLEGDWPLVLALGHGKELFSSRHTPCYESVRPDHWLTTVLNLSCSFEAATHRFTLSKDEIRERRASYNPQQISFLLRDTPSTQGEIDLLRALLPASTLTPLSMSDNGSTKLVLLRTDRAVIQDLRAPTAHLPAHDQQAPALAFGILAGSNLRSGEASTNGSLSIDGSLIIGTMGWYQLGVEPYCDQARLEIDGEPVTAKLWIPLSRGAHLFKLILPSSTACVLPLHFTSKSQRLAGQPPDGLPTSLASPGVAKLPQARAPRVLRIGGYQEQPGPLKLEGTPLDVVAARDGSVSILVERAGQFRIDRLGRQAEVTTTWDVPPAAIGLSNAADGTLFVHYAGGKVVLYDRDGTKVDTWTNEQLRTRTVGHLPGGSILAPLVDQDAIAVIARDGRSRQLWTRFEGGPTTFTEPSSVGATTNGDIVVIQTDGMALQFRTPTERFEPQLVRSFRIDFNESPVPTRGWSFDETNGRFLVPDPTSQRALTFTLAGEVVMATDATRDLMNQRHGTILRVAATADDVYLLDATHTLRRLVALASDS